MKKDHRVVLVLNTMKANSNIFSDVPLGFENS
jgi:hypothetical protein